MVFEQRTDGRHTGRVGPARQSDKVGPAGERPDWGGPSRIGRTHQAAVVETLRKQFDRRRFRRSWGRLSNLVELNLKSNRLSGEIPDALGDLGNLERLTLRDNGLGGRDSEGVG